MVRPYGGRIYTTGCSSDGRAPGWGSGGREFKSRYPEIRYIYDRKKHEMIRVFSVGDKL